jgi:hypothetical protein
MGHVIDLWETRTVRIWTAARRQFLVNGGTPAEWDELRGDRGSRPRSPDLAGAAELVAALIGARTCNVEPPLGPLRLAATAVDSLIPLP